MTAEEKARHISNIAWCIQDGASGYHTDNFKIDNLPTPQRAGTMTQQATYARITAQRVFEDFLKENPHL